MARSLHPNVGIWPYEWPWYYRGSGGNYRQNKYSNDRSSSSRDNNSTGNDRRDRGGNDGSRGSSGNDHCSRGSGGYQTW